MKAAVVLGNCDIAIMEVEEPKITKESEIKIRVTRGAICNVTDNKVYATDHPELEWPNKPFPFIIGHECTGRIVEMGSAVKDMKIGDRVIYWTVCGGAFADYVILDTEEFAVGVIDESVPDDVAAMMEMVIGAGRQLFRDDGTPLIHEGDQVVIYGLGPAGLIYHRLAIMMGAKCVCGVGRRKLRLQKSLELGADFVISSEQEGYKEELLHHIGGHPDVIIDATGADVVKEMIALGDSHTRIIAYGIPPFSWSDRIPEIVAAGMPEPIFSGTPGARAALKKCIEWVQSGKFGLEPIISHRLSLEEVGKGLDLCRLERDHTLKVIITINDK